jgi:hypothetical protein
MKIGCKSEHNIDSNDRLYVMKSLEELNNNELFSEDSVSWTANI